MNLHKFDLNLLVVFDQLMTTTSITESARRLALTQSTVSAALNRLRDHLGDRLLERHGNVMVPTRTALAMWPDVQAALAAAERSLLQGSSFDPASQTAPLRLGFDEYSSAVFGGDLLARFRTIAPNLPIEFLPASPQHDEDGLANGQFDIVVGALWNPLPAYRTATLVKEEFSCLVDAAHPSIAEKLDLATYLALPHLLISTVGNVAGNVDSALARDDLQRRVMATTPHLLAAPLLLIGSNMILHVGQRLAKRFTEWYPVRQLEPPVPIPGFAIAMVWHPRNTESAAHQWLRETLLDVARGV
jgi:LysR family transcriptional regulator, mexEF-oprN operon transcriptional activator